MCWASNILWYIGRQSSILSMPTERFVSASSSSFSSLILFKFIDALPKIRKLRACSFQERGNYFLKILLNFDISTIEVYMARKHSPLIPKERFRPKHLSMWQGVDVYLILIPKSGGKSVYYNLKASDLCLVNTT
jgi:hypothetical protein